MFPQRYFPGRFFTARYWPKIGAVSTAVAGPYRIVAAQIHVPGVEAGQIHTPGVQAGQVST